MKTRCPAIKKDGGRCTRRILEGDMCSQHKSAAKYAAVKEEATPFSPMVLYFKGNVDSYPKNKCEVIPIEGGNGNTTLGVYRKYVEDSVSLHKELVNLKWDTNYYSFGSVKTNRAKLTLKFDDNAQEPDYEGGKNTIVDINSVKNMKSLKESIEREWGRVDSINASYYADKRLKTFSTFRGGAEAYVGVVVGDPICIMFCHYKRTVGQYKQTTVRLEPGDLFVMSGSVLGKDWVENTEEYVVRHSFGPASKVK